MRSAALLVALAAQPAFAQQAPATGITIALNLPVDQPMILTISDRRTLPSDAVVTFTIAHNLRFTATDAGWEATVAQQSVDCAGPANACRAYLAMMGGGNRIERHFAIGRDGTVTMVADERSGALGTTGSVGANASVIVEAAEAEVPGILRAGELREALQFAGQRFELEEVWAGPHRGVVVARRTNDGMVEIRREQLVDGTADAGVARSTISAVDHATGLMMTGIVQTRALPATDAPPMSVRTWRLERGPLPAR